MRELTAKDIMTTKVRWIPVSTTVAEATKMFIEEMISGAPVVDDDGDMVGVVSIKDFLKNGLVADHLEPKEEDAALSYNESWELPLTEEEATAFQVKSNCDLMVKDIMTPVVFNADLHTPVTQLAEMMLKGRIHRVIILDGNELAGMVTSMDMLKVIAHRPQYARR